MEISHVGLGVRHGQHEMGKNILKLTLIYAYAAGIVAVFVNVRKVMGKLHSWMKFYLCETEKQ